MTVEDSLANFGKKLNKVVSKDGIKQDNPVYNVFHSEKSNLQKYFAEYNAKTQPCKLEHIRSHYVDEETRNVLYNMYNRQRSYMQNEWDTNSKEEWRTSDVSYLWYEACNRLGSLYSSFCYA